MNFCLIVTDSINIIPTFCCINSVCIIITYNINHVYEQHIIQAQLMISIWDYQRVAAHTLMSCSEGILNKICTAKTHARRIRRGHVLGIGMPSCFTITCNDYCKVQYNRCRSSYQLGASVTTCIGMNLKLLTVANQNIQYYKIISLYQNSTESNIFHQNNITAQFSNSQYLRLYHTSTEITVDWPEIEPLTSTIHRWSTCRYEELL